MITLFNITENMIRDIKSEINILSNNILEINSLDINIIFKQILIDHYHDLTNRIIDDTIRDTLVNEMKLDLNMEVI